MILDMTSPDSAFDAILDFFELTGSDFIKKYYIDCHGDVECFIETYIDRLQALNIEDIHLAVLHVTSNDNKCDDICKQGLNNLQYVLSEDTSLNRFLFQHNVQFDVNMRTLRVGSQQFNIDYNYYQNKDDYDLTLLEKRLKEIGRKLYFDYQINGFFFTQDVKEYGTNIHERPEFLLTLSNLNANLAELNDKWTASSQGYKIKFLAPFNQFAWFTFSCYNREYEYNDDACCGWLQAKKWMLSLAVDIANSNICGDKYVYMKPDSVILPDQILKISKIQ